MYILFNINGKKEYEKELDNVVKKIPFHSKVKNDDTISYGFCLLFVDPTAKCSSDVFLRYTSKITLTDPEFASLYEVIKDSDISHLDIDILSRIDDSGVSITYSDGSVKMAKGVASCCICKLLNESENGELDLFTNKKYNYEVLKEKINNGTNNIGELTGIRRSVENFDDKQYQIIISDSEYSIKCFREWYYTWKNNNFKNYAGKEISNKTLIEETRQAIVNSNKIVFFKWVKGHANDTFNELCDKGAKEALEEEN